MGKPKGVVYKVSDTEKKALEIGLDFGLIGAFIVSVLMIITAEIWETFGLAWGLVALLSTLLLELPLAYLLATRLKRKFNEYVRKEKGNLKITWPKKTKA